MSVHFRSSIHFRSLCPVAVSLVLILILNAFGPQARLRADEPAAEAGNSPSEMVDFERQVRPLLEEHCLGCHAADAQEGDLRLDSLTSLSAGGRSGSLLIPGNADESLLISAIRYGDESLQMPPDQKLPAEAVQTIVDWINQGARHPDGMITVAVPAPPFDVEKEKQFWAFQPVARPSVPVVDGAVVANPIDAFIAARLTEVSLRQNPAADKRTLIRRATFDLTGLPPTPAEIEAFLADETPEAFSVVIDRLLASPHYGEHWGRHWLDVVRYADSNGLDENVAHGNAFRYRDYVVKSLNDDKPFDQFVREQLAGDLLVTDEMSESQKHELLIGTGFLSLGPKVLAEADKTKMLMDILDEQINTTGVAFMGLTFGCARCHNHKFDPISQADYYSMVGIFKSTYTMESLKTIAKWHENSVATEEDLQRLEEHKSRLEAAKAEIASTIQTAKASLVSGLSDAEAESRFSDETRAALKQLRDEQKQLEASVPELPTAMGVKEGSPETSRINIRGSHLTLGRPVRRDVPAVLRLGPEYQIPETASGRLQFANWLVDPQHPLTARVMVNRVWRWHFGRGIVASTDNFGHLGDHPTHPNLLDWLACELMDGKWSLKSLHRTILLSHTWQQSSESNPAGEDADPANHLLWRSGVHRLDAESIRDAILAVSDRLDRTMGGSLLHVKNREFLFNHTSKDETRYDAPRRSIYLPLIRNNIYDGFSLFDCTDAAVANGNRSTSTVASQALFMMNSELLIESAQQLARVTLSEGGASPQERIDWLFGRTMGRPATAKERNAVIATLQTLRERSVSAGSGPSEGETPRENSEEAAWAIVCQSLLASNEFIYVR